MAEFRAAQAADVGAIVVIDPQGPDRREEIRALVRERASLVAVEHGQIVGFLGIRPALLPPRLRRSALRSASLAAAGPGASPHAVRPGACFDIEGVHFHEPVECSDEGTAA